MFGVFYGVAFHVSNLSCILLFTAGGQGNATPVERTLRLQGKKDTNREKKEMMMARSVFSFLKKMSRLDGRPPGADTRTSKDLPRAAVYGRHHHKSSKPARQCSQAHNNGKQRIFFLVFRVCIPTHC
jgi:hypothetical protein